MTDTTDTVSTSVDVAEPTLPAWINLDAIADPRALANMAATAIEVEEWLAEGMPILARAQAAHHEFTEAIPSIDADGLYEFIASRVPQFVALDVALMKASNAVLNAIGEKDHFILTTEIEEAQC
jgi:hypothetical protein